MYLTRTPRCLIGIGGLACLNATAFIVPIGLHTQAGTSKLVPEYRPAQPYQPQPRPVPNAPFNQCAVITNPKDWQTDPLDSCLNKELQDSPEYLLYGLLFCLCPVSTARFERDPVHKPPWTSLVCW